LQNMIESGKISSRGQLAAAQQELESRARQIESLKLAERVRRGEVTLPRSQGPRQRYEYESWS